MNDAELWDVEIADGIVRTMTLDELDHAYQSGSVRESTRVRQSGAPKWSTIAAVAGMDDSGVPEPVNSISPMQVTLPPPPAVPREFAHLAALDEGEDAFRPTKKGRLAFAGGILSAAAVAGLVAFGVTRATSAGATTQTTSAVVAAPPPEVTSLPAPAPAETAADKRSLTEDQKRALLEADHKRSVDAEKKRAKSAPRTASPRGRKAGDGLLKSGDQYDPLNGKL